MWSAIEIASSVDLLMVYKLEWVQGFWDDRVDVSHDQHFKAFHGYRCECYSAVSHLDRLPWRSLGTRTVVFLRYYRLGQGEVENVS